MLRAPVHFNADTTLMVIPNLVETTFGIQRERAKVVWTGRCLIAQVAFSIAAVTGIRAMTISKHILDHIQSDDPTRKSKDGFTLEEILRTFELPVLTRKGPVWLELGVSVYGTSMAMSEALVHGTPIITIIPREVCDALENEGRTYGDGQSYAVPIRPAAHGEFHSYLAIGLELKSELSPTNFFILRDSRHEYCLNGYLKVGSSMISDSFKNIRALSVDVLSVQH